MPRGRPRKPDPTLPRHIDAAKIPVGVFWRGSTVAAGKGVWWIYEPHPEGGRQRRKTIATETAVLSELHALVEVRTGPAKGTVAAVCEAFHDSTEYRELSAGSRKNYRLQSAFLCTLPTKLGIPFGELQVDRLTPPVIQRLVETIAKGDATTPAHPTKANHLARYLRRTFAWGMRHGECRTNAAEGVRLAKERRRTNMPEPQAFAALLVFARERGQRTAHTEGSVAPYLAPVMEIAYGVRLRGIEVCTLTDAHALPEGIRSNRRKGSLDNITRWTPRLRAAWEALVEQRAAAIARTRKPVPLRADQRALVVSQSGDPLRKSSFDSAWQRLIREAIKSEAITPEQRFSLHGLKHRGVTDTKGTRAVKKDASGHKSDAAFGVYDHDPQVVDAAGDP
jgi:site-specific recombinase XerC